MSEPVVIDQVESGFRLSPQQRRLWALQGQDGGAAQCVLRIEGPLDVSRLERALRGLTARHEILRTELRHLSGMKVPVQCVLPAGRVELRNLDVSGSPTDLQDARLAEQARAEALRSRDPGELALRALLVRRSESRHDLVLTLPALCADRESLRILARETADFYGAPEGPELAEPFQYADFAEWQNELLEGEDREETGEHWRGWQAHAVLSPSLPLARRLAPAGPSEPRALALAISAEILGRLEPIAERHGCGLAEALIAAWQTLLCRLTGEPGLVVGAVFDGRKYEQLEHTLGPCAKTLPVLSRFDGRLRFDELLREVAGVLREAREHQEFFDPDDPVRLDCLFDFDDRPVSFAAGGVTFSAVRRSCCPEAFALALTGERRDGGLALEILYDGRRFEPAGASHLADGFATLLASLAANPEPPLEALAILSPEMQRRIAVDWNSTAAEYPRGKRIDELVEAQAKKTPEAVAVFDRDQEIRYGELDRRANRLAHLLRRLGVGPESIVGLCLERSVERVGAVLAVWKAGGAYVALDPEAPKARKALLLAASRASIVLTEEALLATLPGFAGEVVCLDLQRTALSAESDRRPACAAGPDNLAYIVFTSGSTGEPKGVLAHHRGVVSYLTFLIAAYGLNGADRALQLAALPFDASVRDTFGPLAAGASVILVDRPESRDSAALLRTIRQRGITAIPSIVPSLLRALADGAAEGDLPYGTVRLVLVSGERLYRSDRVKARRLFGEGVAVVNQYGPTECTMTSSFYRTGPAEDGREVELLGRPIANAKLYLLDRDLRLVPAGVAGELYIAGVGVARGYLGRPDLTAERFLPDPFGGEPGARMYRTGDQVRSLLDGDFEFLGRFDHQVKIRGFRIEPGEVEAVLRRLPFVQEAAVVALAAGDKDVRLVAYLGIGGARPPATSELRTSLEETLPAYMIPSAFVLLPNLPLTPNGKVDRRALPTPEEESDETAERRYVAPRTPVEEVLAEVWAEVLGGVSPGREDDFFALGGHSLLATQIMARVRNAFEVELPLQTIFERPTLCGLAERIDEAMRGSGAPRAPRLARMPRGETTPLSFAQERLWFLAQLEPESPVYNVPIALRLEGDLDLPAIEWGLTEMRRRHETLRTTYELVEGRPVQVVHPPSPWGLRRVDLTGLEGERQECEAQRLMGEEHRCTFDLTTGPLARATLVRLAERDHLALFTIHHIASDAWSTGVMVRELSELYRCGHEGVRPTLPELPIQYADYALWQRRWVAGEIVAVQLAYWREQLRGISALELPADRPRPAVLSPSGAVRVCGFSAASAALQKTLGRREGTTLFMTLWAGFAALLCRYTNRHDVTVGTPVAGRHHVETEGLVGCLVNTLVLRADLSGDPSFRELLRRARGVALEAHAHQDLPFERLADELEPERAMNRTPLFQVMLALQNAPLEGLELPGLRLHQAPADTRTAKFDLELNLREVGDRLAGAMTYSADLFDAATIDRMLGHLVLLLEEAAREPARRVSELPLLGPAERQQLVVEWNDGSGGLLCLEECVLRRLRERAESTPAAVAAVFGEVQLTYSELRERAGRLAATLAAAGVERGAIVCLLAERGTDFLTAVLALFETGAAYLPLDPRHPAPRLARVMDQSGSPLVLAATGFLPLLSEALADIPAERAPRVLDLDDALGNGRRDLRSAPCCAPADLAYVIYTSGSTGVPKGVMIEHRGMLSHLAAKVAELGLTAADRVAQTASQTFDISVWQFLAALLAGGRVHIVPDGVAHDPALLLDEIERAGISVLETVPSLLRALLDEVRRRGEEAPRLSSLRWLIPTGEALPPELCREWLSFYPGVPLLNAYGPTECSDDVSHHVLRQPPGESCVRVPIGRPLPNLGLYVLGPELSPLPMQAAGELCVGGVGVGRGYLNDPATTAERFVPDPFAGAPGARMYRTGDLARCLPDGRIDFLGRLDHQVKIRGFRIELQEIEAALAAHPAVRAAAVVARETEKNGGLKLVAYVVPDPQLSAAGGLEAGSPAIAEQWRTVFDEVYRHGAVSDRDAGVSLRVWISSYTGLPFPEEEIFESVEDSVARILALGPSRALEIGCGTGLLLSRIAPRCAEYWGTDISQEALLAARRRLAQRGDGLESRIRLRPGAADRLAGLPERFFDTVVLNEVVQYFPGADYLVRVLAGAVERVQPGGAVFIGGLRSFPLLAAFHASVQLFQASDSLPVDELRQRILAQAAQEKELAVSPGFFLALHRQLPRVSAVRILLKGGRSRNEFTRFRYDVVLEIDGSLDAAGEPPRLDWDRQLDLAALRRYLEENGPVELEIADLPNARALAEVLALDLLDQGIGGTVGDLRRLLREQLSGGEGGIDPEDLRDLGRELGYEVDATWAVSGRPERFDAVLRKRGVKPRGSRMPSGPELSWEHYTSRPHVAGPLPQLAPELRGHLARRLPDYMIPAAFVMLEALPLTPNGKLDRKSLPAPILKREPVGAAAEPLSWTAELLAAIWAPLLGVATVDGEDGFFALGGHSLLATQLLSRIREVFRVDLPLRAVFEEPTLAGLAGRIEREIQKGAGLGIAAAPLFRPVPRDHDLPLSFAQQRLWFLDQLEPGNPTYNVPTAVRLLGTLDVEALERTFREIVRRHEVFRTTFSTVQGTAVQRIGSPRPQALPVVDLRAIPEPARERAALERAAEESRRPFVLTSGPLLRTTLLRLGHEDHVLLVTMHHIVSDGWSVEILIREVVTLYRAFLAGQPSPLPELPVQYADFAVWQREWLSGEALERHLGYWRRQLAGAPPVLALPTDRPRPPVMSYRGASYRFTLPEPLAQSLVELSRSQGTTLFMTLLASFQALLSRYSGQEDLCVGAPIAGRTQLETENLIGFLVNTLVLRGDLTEEPTFRQLLARARETALDAHTYQHLPFEKLVEELRPERTLSHTPLFQVVCVLQNVPHESLALPGLALAPFGGPVETAKFDLVLSLQEVAHGLAGSLVYSTDLFDAATVERMARHLATLLEELVATPDLPVSAAPLLTRGEREAASFPWNAARAAYPVTGCLHDLFAAHAERRPHAVAAVCGEESLTYGDLHRRARRLARHLRSLGVGPEVLVGLCVERSLDMLVGILGILQAAGAYLPLDPAYPQERLAYLVSDSRTPVILSQRSLLAAIPETGARVLLLDDEPLLADGVPDLPAHDVLPEHPAYVIYTSGSTGRPKGVVVSHANVIRLFHSTAPWLAFGEADVWTLFHSFAFDFSVWEIWGALLYGGRLVVVPHLVSREPKAFYEVLRREGVTVLNQTPSAFGQLIDAEPAAVPADLALRAVIFGGEALDLQSLRPWLDRHGDSRPSLVNMYGITETTVHVTYRPILRHDLESAAGSLIGAPLPDLEIFILDRHRQPVPPGVAGEMYVGGAGLARGYLGRPDLTADRFVPHPFADRPGARLYRTGDLARALAGGDIQYLGRIDSQVKIRGFRIELGEIEATLKAHPQVRQAVVLVRERGERRLVAYVVPAPGGAVSAPDLRELVRRRLPEHMVPADFVLLERLPLTAHGKLDRRALPEPVPEPSPQEGGAEAPRTPVEETLAAIWADLLGRERIGIRDNFFDLGGHSLLTTRLISRIREVFRVDLPLQSLFEHPVLAAMAALLEQAIWARPAHPVRRFESVRAAKDDLIPLTMAQQRVWVLQQLDPASPVFNLPKLVQLTGRLNVRALEAAFGEVCRRHESLRTSFREVEGRLVQVVQPESPLRLPLIDLTALPGSVREPEVRRLAREGALRSFDLARGPLLRMALLQESAQSYVLLYTMHHIVSDEWSMDVLRRELVAIYEAFAAGRPSPFAEPPLQYADYALWQQEWLASEPCAAELAYWRRQLAGPVPVLELPMKRARPEVPIYRGGSVSLALPESLSQTLKALSRREGATLFMTLLAAFKALLHLYTGQHDIIVGTNIANRDHLALEGLIGYLSNVLALRTDVSGALSFRDLLGRVRDVALGAYGNQNVPFDALLADLRPQRQGAFAPLFQTMFVWRQAVELAAGSALPASTLVESGAVNFDLTLVMAETPGGLWGAIEYTSDLFEGEVVARIAKDFQRLLAAVADNPELQLADAPLLSREKSHAFKDDFNADFD